MEDFKKTKKPVSKQKKPRISCASCCNTFYDILGQIISILDVCTDIIVCIGFYQKDRMPFFGISLTIILLAFVAYVVAFIFRFSRESTVIRDICLFIILLPISFMLPFIFYFTDSKDTELAKFLQKNCCGFKIKFDTKYNSKDSSKLRQFMEQKLERHFGFIIEALVEAFPQAILQMVAIVTYNEANVVSIISILLSMLSVSSKAFVFSIATALNLKQLLFNWCCAVTDFFGIFFAVSWVFYKPSSIHLSNAFILIRNIWFYKVACELIMIGAISIVVHFVAMLEFYYNDIQRKTGCKKIFLFIVSFLLVTFLWACGIIASALVFEITNWTYLAGILWLLGTTRFSENKTSSEFWFTMVGWVNSAQKHRVGSMYKGCTSFTKQQDKIMRISSINYAILNHRDKWLRDAKLKLYLEKQRKESQYLSVTMSGIRTNTKSIDRGQFFRKFWFHFYGYFFDDVKEDVQYYYNEWNRNGTRYSRDEFIKYSIVGIGVAICTFIFAPIYVITRFTTLLFPGFIVLYLYFGYNINIWNTEFVDMFQTVMISIYLILCVILTILFYMNCCEQYLLAHFLPSESWIHFINSESISNDTIQAITNHYYEIIVIPIRRAMVIEHFGPDLGPIILSYLPLKDHYENANNQVVKPKVVV